MSGRYPPPMFLPVAAWFSLTVVSTTKHLKTPCLLLNWQPGRASSRSALLGSGGATSPPRRR